ncbi:putative protein OS=Streptomyces antimycoticus OX=68175 GN=SANT12839_101450 PE=4 SV=1 [Streptomyces antimycoticus]
MYHARYLRELGLIAYVEHGSKTNVLRTRRERGSPETDTAAPPPCSPPSPRACGTTRTGAASPGPATPRGSPGSPGPGPGASEPSKRPAGRRPRPRTSCTPSVVVPKDHRQVQVVGSKNYTPRQRGATCPKTSRPTTTDRSPVSPTECALGITLTQRLQGEVWWLHRACPRRLAYALRPLITIGWTWQGLAAEAAHLASSRRPEGPGRLRAARARPPPTAGQPPGVAPPEVPADDRTRHAAMLRNREQRNAPIWQRYAQQWLRPVLRRRLAAVRQSHPHQRNTAVEYRSWLREDEEDFARSPPMQS